MNAPKKMRDTDIIAEYKRINEVIGKAECYGKFELNYRAELEEEITRRGLMI